MSEVVHAEGSTPGQWLDCVAAVLARHTQTPGALLPVLHDVQQAIGFVPQQVLPHIAAGLKLSRAEVFGVLTYYKHFHQHPPGRVCVQVCVAEACQAQGADALLEHVQHLTGCTVQQPTSADQAFTVEPIYCLGLCASSPAAMVDGKPHARLSIERLDALLAAEVSQ